MLGDCLEILRQIPNESIDLIFVDPPYNLGKNYNVYVDKKSEKEYLRWSYKWLNECIRLLKPSGSLFIVNLPKWALKYMLFLNKKLYLQHAIAWFGMSEPRGKIMPAHYTILWYTKSKNEFKLNRSELISIRFHPRYVCLRNECKLKLEQILSGNSMKFNDELGYSNELTDVWYDIHRLKHRSKRVPYHPCQLPEKLLERIILLTTDPGDIILDPMCGTGTTLVVAKKLNRHFIGIDIDPIYVEISRKRLSAVSSQLLLYL